MRVRFEADFDWRPHPRQVVAYKAGWSGPVTRACGEAAISAGVAIEVKPKRSTANGESADKPGL